MNPTHFSDHRTLMGRWVALLLIVLLAACRPAEGPVVPPAATPTPARPCAAEDAASQAGVTTVVLIDQTTALEQTDAQQFVRELDADIRTTGGRVQVLTFGGVSPALLRKAFDGTFPTASAAGTSADLWSLTPAERRAASDCLAASRRELDAALSRSLGAVDTRGNGHSPVLEAISAVLGRRQDRHGVMRLIVASDAIEHAGLSFYGSRTDQLRLPPPERVVTELRKLDALPDARQVFVWHVGFGLSGPATDAGLRTLRPPAETAALRRVFDAIWKEAGATAWTYGEPLPPGGFRIPQVRN
jgi:hypothetical protein